MYFISEALAVNNRRFCFVELLLGNPHSVNGSEGPVDGATEPS